jgi:hypothetical protein
VSSLTCYLSVSVSDPQHLHKHAFWRCSGCWNMIAREVK